MPKARNPNRDKAYELWAASNFKIKLKDIAAQLNETENKVRKWKCVDKWEEKANGTFQKNEGNAPKSRGAPKGNKNASGHGAPVGNTNALKHGGYSKIYWDTLTEDEMALIDDMPQDEETLLLDQLKFLSVRERRLMIAINKLETQKTPLIVDSVLVTEHKRQFENSEKGIADKEMYDNIIAKKIDKGEKLPGRDQSITTRSENSISIITRLQAELTKVQKQKTKCIETLSRLHIEKEKLEILKDDNEVEIEDTSDIDEVIYG